MKSQLSVKREMSNAKAPVVAVLNSAIVGLGKKEAISRTYLQVPNPD